MLKKQWSCISHQCNECVSMGVSLIRFEWLKKGELISSLWTYIVVEINFGVSMDEENDSVTWQLLMGLMLYIHRVT